MKIVFGLPSPWDEGAALRVRPWFWTDPDPAPTVRTAIGPHRLMQHRDGYWVPTTTVHNLFTVFGGEWTEIVLNYPDQNRFLFFDEFIQSRIVRESDFQWLRMPEDGHNQEVIHRATFDRGLLVTRRDGWLMVHK